jgi:hypothetical protein
MTHKERSALVFQVLSQELHRLQNSINKQRRGETPAIISDMERKDRLLSAIRFWQDEPANTANTANLQTLKALI